MMTQESNQNIQNTSNSQLQQKNIQQQNEQGKQQKQQKYWKSFITGGIAGIFAKTAVAPFERIKIMYVTRQKQFRYKLALEDAKYIYKQHGFRNFYRGNTASVIRVFPFASINFSTFDYLRNTYWKNFPNEKYIQKRIRLFLCGAFAGMTATSLTYPLELMRVRFAMEKNNFEYKNITSGIQKVIKQEGLFSLYSGWSITLFGVFTYHGIAFFCINQIKEHLLETQNIHAKKWYMDFLVGGIASVIGQSLSYPIDIVKKRMQGQQFLVSHKEQDKKFTNRELIKFILETEGIRGFYKGLSINLIKGPIATGTVWTIKNKLNRAVDQAYHF